MSSMTILQKAIAASFVVCLTCAAAAADVYRWVDDKGVTNLSDVVPEKYKKVAQRVETPAEPDEPTRREAASREAAIASAAASRPVLPAAISARRGGSVATGMTPARSASGAGSLSSSGDNEDCATLQRRYKESQDCFGPRPRTITGAINVARSPQCPIVVDPSPKCGLPNGGEGPPATAP